MGTSFWLPSGGSEFQPTPLALFANATVIEQPVGLDHLSQSYATQAAAFIENSQRSGDPWYLYASFSHVHAPNSCSPKFCGTSKRGPIGDALQEVDDSIGQILAAVDAAGAYNDTIVFVRLDNSDILAPVLAVPKQQAFTAPIKMCLSPVPPRSSRPTMVLRNPATSAATTPSGDTRHKCGLEVSRNPASFDGRVLLPRCRPRKQWLPRWTSTRPS